jgi:SAM-dependent methyltransferase
VSAWRERFKANERRGIGGRLYLEPKFPLDYFKGKRCLDIGCGAGRWTKTLITLGAEVVSADVSEHALQSTRRFNDKVTHLDIFDTPRRPDLREAFDFTLCWGVVMCTHDPKRAFEYVASTVRPGGGLYVMVYAPTYHSSDEVRQMRRRFHRECRTPDDKLRFVSEVSQDPDNAINYMDMLNTFYNWTIPEDVVHNWYRQSGFTDIRTLNTHEPNICGWHVFGRKQP